MPHRQSVIAALIALGIVSQGNAQTGGGQITSNTLLSMPPDSLLALYRGGTPATIAPGPIRGVVLSRTGTSLAGPLARGGRAIWQGKVFRPDCTAVNRFFGMRMVEGRLSQGPSWHDGQPALILDYEHTSRIYGKYRDEIREVAPGLYLGLMYDRTTSPPTFVRFFALER